MQPLTDQDPMPFGKHKGTAMQGVPASYLLWLYENNKCNAQVKQYIEENLDVLHHEVNKINIFTT